MTARSLDDQVSTLLSRTVAETKQLGVQRPELEASAVFDSIALSLLLKPRGCLYFAFLARNALLHAVQEEVDLLDALAKDIADLANPAYRITGAPTLRRAQVALLNLESLPRVSAGNASLTLFNNTVSEFLEKNVSKNVRRVGQADLIRPAAEAEQDLPATVEALKEKHSEVLERLYTLAHGVENFENAPFGAIIGTTTVARARADLEEIISLVNDGGDPEHARDIVVRLLASRATVNTIARPPSWQDTLLAAGAVAKTPTAVATQTGTVRHPFTMPASSVLAIQAGESTSSFGFLPDSAALLVSQQASFPVTVPAGYYLFLTYTVSGVSTPVRIPMNGTFSNAAGVVAKIMAAAVPGLQAVQFANDTSRVLIYMVGAETIAVNPIYVMTEEESRAAGVTSTYLVTLSDSAASYIGLTNGDVGDRTLLADVVSDAINSLFGSIISSTYTADGRISISTLSSAFGVTLRVFGTVGAALGFDGLTHSATATEGVVSGIENHAELLQIGDVLLLPDGKTEVVLDEVLAEKVVFEEDVPTFSGAVSARSVLVRNYTLFLAALKKFLDRWGDTPYVETLNILDRSLAPLVASQSPAQRKEALDAVSSLRGELTSLLNTLADASTMLPPRAALAERKLVESILNTLGERHYVRAIDLLLKCNLSALLEMDDSTASYSGNFMKVSSDLARSSIKMTDPVTSDEPSSYSVGPR